MDNLKQEGYSARKKRWPVAVQGIIANLLLGAMFTWSVYRQPLLVLFPDWTEGLLSVVFSIHNLFICLGILGGGWLSRRFPRRKVYVAFAFMTLIGLGGIAFLPVNMPVLSIILLTFLYTVLASLGIGTGINVVQSATLSWFPDHTGLMSGALYMSLGFSSFILAALSRITLPLWGVKLSFASVGLLVFIVAMLILIDPRAITAPAVTESVSDKANTGIPSRQMLKSLPFWLLIIWNGMIRAFGYTLLDHAASISAAFAAGALAGMLISPANGFGSLFLGSLLDKIGMKKSIFAVSSICVLSALCLLLGRGNKLPVVIIIGLMLGGMAYGGGSSTYAASIKLVFGEKYFSSNFGFSNFSLAIGAVISTFSGSILDSAGGDYGSLFIMIAILLIPIFICTIVFYKANTNLTERK